MGVGGWSGWGGERVCVPQIPQPVVAIHVHMSLAREAQDWAWENVAKARTTAKMTKIRILRAF